MDAVSPSPSPRRRLLSWALRAFCIALVPLVVFANPQTAQAVTYSTPVTGVVELASGPGSDAKCNVTAYWKVTGTTPTIVLKATCEEGWLSSIDTISFRVSDAQCRLISPELTFGSTLSTTLVLDPLTAILYNRDGCSPTTAVANACDDKWVGETKCTSVEFALPLGQPPLDAVKVGSCPYFDVKTPRFDAPTFMTRSDGKKGWDSLMRAEVTWKGAGEPSYGNWVWYAIYAPIDGGTAFPSTGPTQGHTAWDGYPFNTDVYYPDADTQTYYAKELHVGQNVMGNTLSGGTTTADFTGWFPVSTHTTGGSAQPAGRLVGVGVLGYRPSPVAGFDPPTAGRQYGQTIPANCTFYWGEKVSQVAGTTADEPLGPTGAVDVPDPNPSQPGGPGSDPDDQSAGCGFSWTDPSTYASAGICKLVGLFGQAVNLLSDILGALGDLASTIAGAIADALEGIVDFILDGIESLFLPGDGYFDGKVADTRQAFNDTKPGHVVDSFGSADWNVSASGCSGIPVDWGIYGQSYDFDLLAACSGPTATAAGVVKLAASCFLVIFGAIGCVRSLGTGLGWSPGIGKGAA